LSGEIDDSAVILKSGSNFSARIGYGAYLLRSGDWAGLYKLFGTDKSPFHAPLRIWSAIALKKDSEALKFIDSMPANDSWKHFARGSLYAERKDFKKAAASFAKIEPSFLNLNDYLYLLSFYNAAELSEAAQELKAAFTETPGGLFMLEYDKIPAFSEFSGIKNQLSFSIIQTVSHSQAFGATDLALVLLRMAAAARESDALDYYTGMYFYGAGGDYAKYFDRIGRDSPFHSFVLLKYAESAGNYREETRQLERVLRARPLFVPAATRLIAKYIQNDSRGRALSVANRALRRDELTGTGRAFFLRTRARINRVFGRLDAAQEDLDSAATIIPKDAGVLTEQALIWAAKGQNLDAAYAYGIALVKKYPADVELWDTLGQVVMAKEGAEAALEIYEKVGRVADSCSSLFEHMGDALATLGEFQLAAESYERALLLSDDGLIIAPQVSKKLKTVKRKL
jgi:tetratricopeptide (TPR) repeat protein